LRIDREGIVIGIAPVTRVMALGALATIVFIGSVLRMAAFTVSLAGVVKLGVAPVVRVVAVGTLPAEVVGRFIA
jgi:hypothetical protein